MTTAAPIIGYIVDLWSLETALLISGILATIILIGLSIIVYVWNGRKTSHPKQNHS